MSKRPFTNEEVDIIEATFNAIANLGHNPASMSAWCDLHEGTSDQIIDEVRSELGRDLE